MLQVPGGERRSSPAKPWSENTGEPRRRSRWYVWGRASKRELLRQKEWLQVSNEPAECLPSDHTRVGFSKMSIHESFLVVVLSIFFPYRSVIICLKYLGDPVLFYIFASMCVCVCILFDVLTFCHTMASFDVCYCFFSKSILSDIRITMPPFFLFSFLSNTFI